MAFSGLRRLLRRGTGTSEQPAERDLVFNVVWTGPVFPYLRHFVASQIRHSEARFRFVVNGCPPEQVRLMERFAEAHPDRVVEVLEVCERMEAHGVALDRVRARRDEGDWFCLIDPDIKANAPWVGELTSLLGGRTVAVSSGKEVWATDNLVPEGHPGVAGEFYFDRKGFTFGSPHLAIYRRDELDATCERWGIGLGSAGPELRDDTKAALISMGHEYKIYDTGKIVNALLQIDGDRLVHRDLDQLVHIGGLSHYLSPSDYITLPDGSKEPEWARWQDPRTQTRLKVARHTALLLRHLCDGGPAPVPPEGVDQDMAARLARVEAEVKDLVATYAEELP